MGKETLFVDGYELYDHPLYIIWSDNRDNMCDEWVCNSMRFISYWVNNGWRPGSIIESDGEFSPEKCKLRR